MCKSEPSKYARKMAKRQKAYEHLSKLETSENTPSWKACLFTCSAKKASNQFHVRQHIQQIVEIDQRVRRADRHMEEGPDRPVAGPTTEATLAPRDPTHANDLILILLHSERGRCTKCSIGFQYVLHQKQGCHLINVMLVYCVCLFVCWWGLAPPPPTRQ